MFILRFSSIVAIQQQTRRQTELVLLVGTVLESRTGERDTFDIPGYNKLMPFLFSSQSASGGPSGGPLRGALFSLHVPSFQ